MTHSMQLQPAPFEKIKAGTKTIELRLFDDKRRKLRTGDTIVFTNTESNIDTASPDDMDAYYPKEMQQKYGVVGIRISLR